MILMIGGTPDDWGLIPGFLDVYDPRPAREQFNSEYISGWDPFKGFTLDHSTMTLSYSGDPPYRPISVIVFRDERIYLYPSAWVLILQEDGSWEVCRMD